MTATALTTGASQQAIQDHYDLSNQFYRLWLDPLMVYSGAMWQEGDDLQQAQIRKLEHHIAASRAQGKSRVLEIGCGWGALLDRLVDHHGVSQAVGLTLSQAQLDWMRAAAHPKVEAHLEAWQDHQPGTPYDAIISIGAFEHFASLDMSEAEKVEAYRRFFAHSRELLHRGGYLSLQTFAYGSAFPRDKAKGKESTEFLAREIFRETDPPRLANIAEAIEGRFELIDMHNDRLGYARTCKAWLDNMRQRQNEAVRLIGRDAYQRYQTYLSYSYIGFKTGNLDLYRITLKRVEPRVTVAAAEGAAS
ncbi:MAG TPA: class I SAM-dependent methyltransferase [Kofleriaceae bacterium]|jgi:cyclopropane-fatty-acyl-phospholipid synthase|nr:class I SAM-dependent methyltransferase [Kofleriaceae bacterium]